MAFCITFFLAILLEGVLLGVPKNDVLINSQIETLFVLADLLGLIVARSVSVKYYWYLGKQQSNRENWHHLNADEFLANHYVAIRPLK